MALRVITPPSPIVTPADIAGDHAADDAGVASMIAAVTEQIDGPTGWLGRAIGPQTLELTLPAFCGRFIDLPCPPFIGPAVVKYLDTDQVEQTVSDATYRVVNDTLWFDRDFSYPATACEPDALRIRYPAGYNGAGDGKTGEIPARVRQAIILSVTHLKSISVENLYVREIDIPDVETMQFTLSDIAGAIVEKTCDRLLTGLRRYV